MPLRLRLLDANQALISTPAIFFEGRVFFLATIRYNGKFYIHTSDIDQSEARKLIPRLKVDDHNAKMTAYCNPGYSFKDQWNSIEDANKHITF